jgi:hypothetical protein
MEPRKRHMRYTNGAKEVLQLASEHARKCGGEQILPCDLLEGMLQHRIGVAGTVLSNFGIESLNYEYIYNEIDTLITHSYKVDDILCDAQKEATRLKHHYIGTEHLLLAYCRHEITVENIPSEKIIKEVMDLIGKSNPTITLVGSSRFKKKFHEIGYALEKRGHLVFMMSFFGHSEGIEITPEEREILKKVDKRRIDHSDEVWVIDEIVRICSSCNKEMVEDLIFSNFWCKTCQKWANPIQRPYWGEHTQYEIDYALAKGKPVRYMNAQKEEDRFSVSL